MQNRLHGGALAEVPDPAAPPARAAAEARDRRLRALLDATQVAIVAVDARHVILEANAAVERLLGHPRDTLIGANLAVLLPRSVRAPHPGYVDAYLEGGPSRVVGYTREVMAEHADGSSFPLAVSLDGLSFEEEPLFIAVLRDVRHDTTQLRELTLRRDELLVQAEINQVVLHSRDIDSLLVGVLEALVTIRELEVEARAGVFLADPERRVLRLAHTVGAFDEEFLRREAEIAYGACLCGRAALNRKVIVSSNSTADDRHEHRFPLMQPHGHYIVPLVNGDDLLGVIFLYTHPGPGWDARRLGLFETLGVTIGGALRRLEAERELRVSREALFHLATHDPLTGCPNRRLALERLETELGRAARAGGTVAVVLFDVDHFKEINDTYGHLVGDVVLREVAARLSGSLRSYDVCGRFGGEEFLVVLPETDEAAGSAIAERLRVAVGGAPVRADGAEIVVRISGGLVVSGDGPDAIQAVLRAADAALYRAKALGRDRIELAERQGADT